MKLGSKYQQKFLTGLIILFSPFYVNAQNYLDDVDIAGAASPMNNHGYPRVILSETKAFKGNMERYTKYHIVTGQTASKKKISQIQSLNPNVMYFWHMSPRAYQGYLFPGCQIGAGMQFTSSGPTTQGGPPSRGCSIYAGHWLYRAGSKLTQSITATSKTLKLQDVSNFQVGQYVVIYNAPAGSFNNAEHAKITGKNTSAKTLTVTSRGYKSVAKPHPSGAIVAQHVIGQGGGSLNWSYNMSTQSPKDANGKTAGQAMADWAKANEKKDKRGDNINIRVDGIQFDADFYDELSNKKSDVNNDLVIDHGLSPSGVNWWGLGLEAFYKAMRNRFGNNKFIIAGNRRARGFADLSGTQMEAFPAKNRTQPVPTYGDIDSQFSRYSFHLHYNKDNPLHTHNLNKTPTRVYPEGHPPSKTSNSVFRLGLGLTLLDDGYYGHENSNHHPDPWYDEFAVDTKAGSSTYGRAIKSNQNNEAAVRANMGWLGNPLGERFRIVDSAQFAANKSLMSNATFDSNINGWSGLHVNVSRDTSTKKDGSASIRVSKMTKYQSDFNKAKLKGPKVNLVKGNQYTMVFSARSTAIREFTASVGGNVNKFIVGPTWRRFVLTFTAKKAGGQLVSFGVGRENLQMWFDTVHVFKGNANVFRRNFQKGTVVVNATPSSKTVNLGTNYKRIKGFQDAINNGATLSSVTIKPWDAAILVKPDGGGNPPPPPPPTGTNPCGKPSYNAGNEKGLIIWKTCDGSGRWHLRGIAGGTGGGIRYEGHIKPNSGKVSNVSGVDLEQHDSMSIVNSSSRINLSIKMWDGFEDGVNFTAPDSVKVCFNMSPSSRILVGKNRTQKSGSLCLK